MNENLPTICILAIIIISILTAIIETISFIKKYHTLSTSESTVYSIFLGILWSISIVSVEAMLS